LAQGKVFTKKKIEKEAEEGADNREGW